MRILSALLLVAAASTVAQTPDPEAERAKMSEMVRWPVVRPRDAKAEREQNLKDMARMTQLLTDLRNEMSQNEHVISVSAVKKAEEIEKLIKRVRSRLR
jgi:hypothetical protein